MDNCELTSIGYWELREWRNICDRLAGYSYKWIAGDEEDSPLLDYHSRGRRKFLWELYKIQFVRWCENPAAQYRSKPPGIKWKDWEAKGWQLIGYWEHKIWFLEQVVLLDRSPYSLSMPWIKEQPKPWDAVLGGDRFPAPYDAVLGGNAISKLKL